MDDEFAALKKKVEAGGGSSGSGGGGGKINVGAVAIGALNNRLGELEDVL